MKRKNQLLAMLMAVLMLFSVCPIPAKAVNAPMIVLEPSCENMKVISGSKVYLDFIIQRNYMSEYYVVNIYKGRSTSDKDFIGYGEDFVDYDADLVALELSFNSSDWNLAAGTTCTIEYYLEYWDGSNWRMTTPQTSTFQIIKNTCGSTHNYGSPAWVFSESSCSKEGYGAYLCSKCGVRKKAAIPKTSHSYDAGRVTKNATCKEEGVRTYTCKNCKGTKTQAIPKSKHVYDNGYVQQKETCTKDGIMLYTCKGCGTTKTGVIPKAHKWNDGITLEDATVSTPGSKDCICTVCGTPGIVEIPAVFSDVYTDWYTEYVQYVYDHTLMTGIKGTTKFQPNSNITKAQVAQVLYNMEGQPNVYDQSVFSQLKDVYSAEWYANAVAWAYSNGIVTGDLTTLKFSPNADVTREQLALMLYRYASSKGYDTSQQSDFAGLTNADKVSNWAADGMSWAVGAGLIGGMTVGNTKDLAPQKNASRAQVAAILMRFCTQYYVEPAAIVYEREPMAVVVPEFTEEPQPEETEIPQPEVTVMPQMQRELVMVQ